MTTLRKVSPPNSLKTPVICAFVKLPLVNWWWWWGGGIARVWQFTISHAYLTSFCGASADFHNSLICILLILITYAIVHTHSDDVAGICSHVVKDVAIAIGRVGKIVGVVIIHRDVIRVRVLYHIVEAFSSPKRRIPLNRDAVTCSIISHSQITNSSWWIYMCR